ncbi:hypothetical protein ACIREO_22550 [Streptomyces sp. NPDC102441]|uniref:hypothetical protein n=1 Tax=Streptomyces sp. NPDC102441 TaxID=3366176 RepID=UPI003818700F
MRRSVVIAHRDAGDTIPAGRAFTGGEEPRGRVDTSTPAAGVTQSESLMRGGPRPSGGRSDALVEHAPPGRSAGPGGVAAAVGSLALSRSTGAAIPVGGGADVGL